MSNGNAIENCMLNWKLHAIVACSTFEGGILTQNSCVSFLKTRVSSFLLLILQLAMMRVYDIN